MVDNMRHTRSSDPQRADSRIHAEPHDKGADVRLRTTAAGSRPSSRWIAAPVLALTALAATGGTASATSYWSSPPRYPTNTSATATMSAAQITVQTKNNAELGTILADGQGLTLYTLTSNGSPVLCSGACTMFWPPLVVAAGMS